MNKVLAFCSLLFCAPGLAQTVHHIQSGVVGEYVVPYGEDSAISTVFITSEYDYRIAVYNLKTLDWRYTNQESFSIRPGQNGLVMRDDMNGISAQHDNSVLHTSNGWKTASKASGVSANHIGITKNGYYATNYFSNSTFFYSSEDGNNWTLEREKFGLYRAAAHGDKIVAMKDLQDWRVSYDGGKSYSNITTNKNPYIQATAFWLPDTAIYYVYDKTGKLWRSTNSGENWTSVTLPATGSINFKNATEGVLVSQMNDLYFTADSGLTWQKSASQLPSGSGKMPYFVNDYIYFGSGLRTADKGNTFEAFFHNIVYGKPFDLDFNKNGIGLLSGIDGQMYLSKNGGRSFTMLAKKPSSDDIMAVKALSNNTLLAADRRGQIYISKDFGENWSKKNTEVSGLNGVGFGVSADEEVIVLRRLGQPLISVDGGETFAVNVMGGGNHDQAVAPNGTIYDASNYNNGALTDSMEIHIVDAAKKTKKSILRIYSPSTVVNKLYMASNNVGYVLGVNKSTYDIHIFRTTNAWQSVTKAATINAGPGAYNGLVSIYSFGTDSLVMVPHGKNFYHFTTNGGQSWQADTFRSFGKTVTEKTMGSHFFTFGRYIVGLENSKLLINYVATAKDTTVISIGPDAKNSTSIIALYPNPANTYIRLQMQSTQTGASLQAKIYDLSGRMVSDILLNNTQEIPVENLQKGMYILHIYQRGKMLGQAKFIKQ